MKRRTWTIQVTEPSKDQPYWIASLMDPEENNHNFANVDPMLAGARVFYEIEKQAGVERKAAA